MASRERQLRYREQNPAGYAARLERQRWRQRARGRSDEDRAAARAWYADNREFRKAQVSEWQRAHPDEVRMTSQIKRGRRRGAPLTDAGRDYVRILSADPCAYCGATSTSIDHIVPIVAGGDSDWLNLTASCATCNPSKGPLPLLQFLLRRAA